MEGVYADDIFKEQLELLDKKIAEAYVLMRQQQLKSYDINLLCKFVKEKLARPYETYVNGDIETKKILLCSIYPQGIKWMYPGMSNTGISPQYQQIRDIAKRYVPYGEPGGSILYIEFSTIACRAAVIVTPLFIEPMRERRARRTTGLNKNSPDQEDLSHFW